MKYDSFFADDLLFHSLAACADNFHCVDNQTLFEQGELANGLHLVLSGEVALQLLSYGGDVLASFSAFQGSILGLPAVAGKAPYTLSAIARKGAEIGFIDIDTFHKMMQDDTALYPAVMSLLATEVRSARTDLVDCSGCPDRERKNHKELAVGLNCSVQLPSQQMQMPEGTQDWLFQG